MITKYEISPWGDNVNTDFSIDHQQVSLSKSQPLKLRENKLLRIRQNFIDINDSCVKQKRTLEKFKEVKKDCSILSSKSCLVQKSNPQLPTKIRMHKKYQSQLLPQDTRIDINQHSQRTIKQLHHSLSAQQKIQSPKKQDIKPAQQQQNLIQFFSVVQKQKINWNKISQRQQSGDIFMKLEEISIKRKKQIKLPRISVAYTSSIRRV